MWLLHLLLLLAPASCAIPLRDLQGQLDSPNYPQGYPNDVSQSWEIEVPRGYGIKLYFTHLDIEPSDGCDYDYVQIFSDEALHPQICGTKGRDGKKFRFPHEYYTSGNWMTVTFKSDFSNEERYTGFSAYYTAVDINECQESNPCSHYCNNFIGGYHCSCRPGYFLQANQRLCGVECSGEVFTRFKGLITSPNYPTTYAENSQCRYRIKIEAGFEVVLSFGEDFDVEGDPATGCGSDVLKVMSRGDEYGPFCGTQAPVIARALGNVVDITFRTDEQGDNRGWKMTYSSTAKQCPVDILEHGVVRPRAPEYDYKDAVRVSCEPGYELHDMQKNEHLKSATVHCQKDGSWNSSVYTCNPVDCGNPGTVRNGRVKFSSTVFKSRSTYSCDEPYYRLNGNSTYECSTDAEWVDVTGGDPTVPKCKPVCGRSGLSSEHGRIFGGRRANPGYFPWQVRLHTADGVRGAGALISDGWVLTAAHLFDGSRQASMWAGAVSLADAAADPPVQLEGAVLHPGYRKQRADRREYNFDHDIALVRLRRKVRLGPLLSPVCLPGGRAPETGRLGFIAGWGKTETRQLAVHLQYARVPVARMDKCEGLDYRGRVPTFTANMICAGQIPASSSRNADSCQGDSGGAYVFTDARDPARHVVRGIVSFGPPQCGSFGVYTNVGNYIDWIQKTVEEWEDSESGEVED